MQNHHDPSKAGGPQSYKSETPCSLIHVLHYTNEAAQTLLLKFKISKLTMTRASQSPPTASYHTTMWHATINNPHPTRNAEQEAKIATTRTQHTSSIHKAPCTTPDLSRGTPISAARSVTISHTVQLQLILEPHRPTRKRRSDPSLDPSPQTLAADEGNYQVGGIRAYRAGGSGSSIRQRVDGPPISPGEVRRRGSSSRERRGGRKLGEGGEGAQREKGEGGVAVGLNGETGDETVKRAAVCVRMTGGVGTTWQWEKGRSR